jgi:hypothetical protein
MAPAVFLDALFLDGVFLDGVFFKAAPIRRVQLLWTRALRPTTSTSDGGGRRVTMAVGDGRVA